jgi:hypothetical protein
VPLSALDQGRGIADSQLADKHLDTLVGRLVDIVELILGLFLRSIVDTNSGHHRVGCRLCRLPFRIDCRCIVPEDSGDSSTYLVMELCMVLMGQQVLLSSLMELA